jgi:hypothetical protein
MTRPDAPSARPTERDRQPSPVSARTPGPLFGFLEQAAWIISDPEGGQLPACETDVDLPSNDADAIARIPPDSSIRLEVWGG